MLDVVVAAAVGVPPPRGEEERDDMTTTMMKRGHAPQQGGRERERRGAKVEDGRWRDSQITTRTPPLTTQLAFGLSQQHTHAHSFFSPVV